MVETPDIVRAKAEGVHREMSEALDSHVQGGRAPAGLPVVALERSELDVVGEAHPSLVEEDQPRERREALAETTSRRVGPHRTQMRKEAVNEDEIRRSFSQHLVGDMYLTVAGVADPAAMHVDSVASTIWCTQNGFER